VEQDKEEDGFAHQVGKRPRKEQAIVFPGTRQIDKRSHRRSGNKNPERCSPNDWKRCRIRDRSQRTPTPSSCTTWSSAPSTDNGCSVAPFGGLASERLGRHRLQGLTPLATSYRPFGGLWDRLLAW